MSLRLHAPVVLPCTPGFPVLRDAVIDIDDDGRVAGVGPALGAPATDAPTTNLPGIVLPGLVNAHAHTAMTGLRGLGGDLPLMPWLTDVIWPAEGRMGPDDVYAASVVGTLEMLTHGITTSVEMYFHTDAMIAATLDTGARALITPGVIAVPGWDRLGSWERMLEQINTRIDADGLRQGPGERVELGYGPHSAYTLPADALVATAAAARERGALLHTHVAESRAEDAAIRAEHGSVPALLDRLGVLADGARVLAAHAVHLSDADIAVLATGGVAVAHCPVSNGKLASGVARLLDLLGAGVPVGLGTDGPASHDDLDLWADVRLAATLARLGTGDAAALDAASALTMATSGGAAAIGRPDLGSLRPGNWADLVHVHPDHPAFAAGLDVPDSRLVANLVWGGGSRAVADVWVAGEPVVSDGAPVRVDRAAAHARLRERVHVA